MKFPYFSYKAHCIDLWLCFVTILVWEMVKLEKKHFIFYLWF